MTKTTSISAYLIVSIVVAYIGNVLGLGLEINPAIAAVLVVTLAVGTEILNRWSPSGKLFGATKNLSGINLLQKITFSALAVLQVNGMADLVPQEAIDLIVPLLDIIIRMTGGATQKRIAASKA